MDDRERIVLAMMDRTTARTKAEKTVSASPGYLSDMADAVLAALGDVRADERCTTIEALAAEAEAHMDEPGADYWIGYLPAWLRSHVGAGSDGEAP